MRAIAAANLDSQIVTLSARKPVDLEMIEALPGALPLGTVLIDDFHRLEASVKLAIADLMKVLADEGARHSKLIVLGIPTAGQTLLSFGKDLTNRVEIVRLESNPTEKIAELVTKGEVALNSKINIKDEIVDAAQGSFYLAQMLSFYTMLRSNITTTPEHVIDTKERFESIKTHVMKILRKSFHDTAIAFARGERLRPEGRAPYLHLLYWLSQSPTWTINIRREVDRHPQQRGSVTQVTKQRVSKSTHSQL